MKKLILIILVFSWSWILLSTIDSTLTINSQLMQQLRLNANPQTYTDPFIYYYISRNRNDDADPPINLDNRVSNICRELNNMARDVLYYAIKYSSYTPEDLQTIQAELQEVINGISSDSSSNKFIYIKPLLMTSGNQPIDGNNPGSLVHLLSNTDDIYHFCYSLPFNANNMYIDPETNQLAIMGIYDRIFTASYGLTFISFIYDMLYYEMTPIQRSNAHDNLQVYSDYLYNFLQNPNLIGVPNWDSEYLPLFKKNSATNQQFDIVTGCLLQIVSALGYSRIVLGYSPDNDIALSWAIDMLDTIPFHNDKHGVIEYLTKESGLYAGGPDYSSEMLSGPPQVFFTALKRKFGINIWNNDNVEKWMNATVDNITPLYYTVPVEDCWWDTPGMDRGLLEYFYQNDNDLIGKQKIRWFLHRKRYLQIPSWPTTENLHFGQNWPIVYSFNPNNSLVLTDDTYSPHSIQSGIFSNQEYTHLSAPRQLSQTDDSDSFKNRLWLHVVHENSEDGQYQHISYEKGHYRLYYDCFQYIIDPGYRVVYKDSSTNPYVRTLRWFASIYSKNMIVCNPDYQNEKEYINNHFSLPSDTPIATANIDHKRPVSGSEWSSYQGVSSLADPCWKDYLYTNNNIRHIKVTMKLNDLNTVNQGIDNGIYSALVNRHFYSLGNDFVIAYDKVSSLLNPGQINSIRNQIHFHPDAYITFNNQTGVFSVQKRDSGTLYNSFLFGATGSLSESTGKVIDGLKDINGNSLDPNYPYGIPTGGYNTSVTPSASGVLLRSLGHSRIRVESSNPNDEFLTVYLPSNINSNPITEVSDTDHGYLIYADSGIDNQFYCGISNLSFQQINNVQISTDARFFMSKSNNEFNSVKSLVVNNGNYYNVTDLTGLNFGTVDVFHNYSSDTNEFISEWDDGSLTLTCRSDIEQYPMVKILRCGILPQNLIFRVIFPHSGGDPDVYDYTIPNQRGVIYNAVQRLAYDDTYFYINYGLDDLISENLLSDNLFIYKGEYSYLINWTILNFNGPEIILTGDWTIPPESTINITGNSSITLSPDFNITIDGILSINGDADNVRCSLNSPDENNWGQIIVNSCGRLEMQYVNIEKAAVIQSRGKLDCRNVTINDCEAGIMLISRADGWIENTVISHCNSYGLVLQNCEPDAFRSRFSKLHINNNKYGIFLYNSSPIIDSIMVVNNDEVGVLCMRNSNPYITLSAFSDTYIHINDNERPEFTLYQSCYPILEKNDIIFGDGNSLFSYDPNPHPYACPNNYWGTINEDLIRDSFYPGPEIWSVDFLSFLTEPITSNANQNLVTSYFEQAVNYEQNNELATARLMYKTIIVTYPTHEVAMAAASRLVCIADTEEEIILAKNYLEGIYNQYPSTKLAESARLDYLICQRLLEEYSEAIAGYQELLENCSTYIDSLLTQLDIIYTFLEAESNGTKALTQTVMCMGEPLISSKRAKELESQILGILLNQPYPGEVTYHVPDYMIVTDNYPNPFNPSTTIRFSIPKSSDCELIIYNVKGQAVKHLIKETKERGTYKLNWDSKDDRGNPAASGIYFYRLKLDGKTTTKKMMLMK